MPKRIQPELPVIAKARAAMDIAKRTIRAIEKAGVEPWKVSSLINEHFDEKAMKTALRELPGAFAAAEASLLPFKPCRHCGQEFGSVEGIEAVPAKDAAKDNA